MKNIIGKYKSLASVKSLHSVIDAPAPSRIYLKGLSGSSAGLLLAALAEQSDKQHFVVFPDKEQAGYFFNDISRLTDVPAYLFPSSFRKPGISLDADIAGGIMRTETLQAILFKSAKRIVVTSADALAEKTVTAADLNGLSLKIHTGEKLSIDFVTDLLNQNRFVRTDFVFEPGQYAVRGSIIDIFSFASPLPVRIDFFGDTVDTLRSFDIDSQISVDTLSQVVIVPDLSGDPDKQMKCLLEQINNKSVLWMADPLLIKEQTEQLFQLSLSMGSGRFVSSDELFATIEQFTVIETGLYPFFPVNHQIIFNTHPQPVFNKNFSLLAKDIDVRTMDGYLCYILTSNPKQIDRLTTIFTELSVNAPFTHLPVELHEGFIDDDLKICMYTDHQIFDRFHRYEIRNSYKRSESLSLRELQELNPGDYVVHVDHGIGRFAGLEKIDVNGKQQEAVKLIYRDNDVLYVNIHSLHRITKYRGADGEPPKVYKLGSGSWQKLKQNTKRKVKDIARGLIELYAKRKITPGFAFGSDNYLQQELESSFEYEDTPDQLKATKMVKQGMEAPYPMDMLVCGDVGFGKTEVAVRAAFKAVCDSKQVAVLVPTTILAFQHFKTFSGRLKDLPVNVDYISRLRSTKEQSGVIKKLKSGEIDILIGTHRLLGKEIIFKDLGLLIIDEEQKFGVAAKEKIKQFCTTVDTLTLTATPIPRTMQFSLMGARDLTVINTPPPNRQPIITEIHVFNEEIIRQAIHYEINRNGQVFFLHNRVQNIDEVQKLLIRLCPSVKTVIAHGQMHGHEIENVMLAFMNGDYDVLIATTIIENGLDIPNANTIIINEAHTYGLSDLHQLRGRVGRSNRKAFCYLLCPPLNLLAGDAKRRLKAIEDFSGLGSGFSIALQDLDIRGAGDLLGAEQSGFINDIGFETYQRILDEALLELKQNEFKEVFYQENETMDSDARFVTDCQLDTDFELLFPDEYVPTIQERMRLYKRLDSIANDEELLQFEQELSDRFGALPKQAVDLMNAVRLRKLAIEMGFEKVIVKGGKMVIWFVSDQQSAYFQSELFQRIIQFIQRHPAICRLKEANNRLSMIIENVSSIGGMMTFFNMLRTETGK